MSDAAIPAAKGRRKRRRPSQGPVVRELVLPDFLPPEGVPLTFTVAGLGGRFAAQLVDIAITVGFVLGILLVLVLLRVELGDGWSILFMLLFFLIRAPYYILTELVWNGQTLGKRITGLRVINASGGSLEPYSVVVRNLMKEMEVFVPGTYILAAPFVDSTTFVLVLMWIVVLLLVPLVSKRRQRLGDMVANTVVIHHPRAVLVADLAAKPVTAFPVTGGVAGGVAGGAAVPVRADEGERYVFQAHQLDHYGRYELQTLERVLHAGPPYPSYDVKRRHEESLATISAKIRAKIEYPEDVPDREARAFLDAFYRAQRAYLESRKLFGEERADKFHREDGKDG